MINMAKAVFLYSQDLSNYKTSGREIKAKDWFLYSQDLSNYKTVLNCWQTS